MFVRSASPIWYFPNLVGAQLDDTYYLFTLANTFPYVPVPIYHDPDGLIPWTDPIQFLPNGTLDNNMFWNPNQVYRLEVRQGPTQADPLIYLIENYVPNGSGEVPPIVVGSNIENQISNGQFFNIDFVSPITIAAAGTYDVAPGWTLTLTGTGSTTLTQVINLANAPTTANPLIPPYALTISNTGWTTAVLSQRFNNLGDPWTLGFVCMSLTGISNSGGPLQIVTQYVPQSPGTATTIISDLLPITEYTQLQNSVTIPPSTNTHSNLGSYVDIQILLPVNGSITISDIYVAPQASPIQITYLQETIERQEDHLFHYYKDSILIHPKDSILTGWNFPLNPWQFTNDTLTATASQCYYTADQTIYYQRANNANKVGAFDFDGNSSFQVDANSTTNNQFAIIQYIDPLSILPYWGSVVSSLVTMGLFSSGTNNVSVKMRLIYRTTLPSTIGTTEPIASWAGPGTDPVFSAGWTALKPINDPAYLLTPTQFSNLQTFAFNGFQLPFSTISGTNTLAIVLYTTQNISNANSDTVCIERVSLVPNEFAIDSNPQTVDEVLRQCQYYYETSYQSGAVLATATSAGILVSPQHIVFIGASKWAMPYATFGHTYSVKKRDNSSITLYSPTTAAANNIRAIISRGATPDGNADVALAGGWSAGTLSQSGFYFTSGNVGATVSSSGSYINTDILSGAYYYHFVADSRLGR